MSLSFSLSLVLLCSLPLHISPASAGASPCTTTTTSTTNTTTLACAKGAASLSTLKESPHLSRARALRGLAQASRPGRQAREGSINAPGALSEGNSVNLVHRRRLKARPRAEWAQISVVLTGFNGVTWQGFGTTLGRFAHFVGGLPNLQRQKILHLLFDPLRGLGLSIVRYVIPAGFNPNKSPSLARLRFQAVPGFRQDLRYPYNWNADRNQRRVLMGAVKRGAEADAVSYSAPWWATINGNVAGNAKGPNLAPKNYASFANYATDVVLHYARAWGVSFTSLGPFNDPFENNLKGKTAVGAAAGEGCGFKLTQVPFVLNAFRAALKKKGLQAVKLAGVDDWLERTDIAFTSAPPIRNLVDRITVHGYQVAPTNVKAEVALLPKLQAMNNLRQATKKEVWVSEWGPRAGGKIKFSDFGVAMASAKAIIQMVNKAGASAFIHAQAVTPINAGYPSPFVASYGMIRLDFNNPNPKAFAPKLSKQFYLQQQLSRALPKGSKPISLAGELSHFIMAAYHPNTHTLSVTVVNEQRVYMYLTLDVSRVLRLHGLARKGLLGTIYRTSAAENNHLTHKGHIGKIEITPVSITTIFIRNVNQI